MIFDKCNSKDPDTTKPQTTAPRGFAAMTAQKRREIAALGGKAISKDREHMINIGRKGGELTSQDRSHMADIGRRGGIITSRDTDHMAEIGQMGGETTQYNNELRNVRPDQAPHE